MMFRICSARLTCTYLFEIVPDLKPGEGKMVFDPYYLLYYLSFIGQTKMDPNVDLI